MASGTPGKLEAGQGNATRKEAEPTGRRELAAVFATGDLGRDWIPTGPWGEGQEDDVSSSSTPRLVGRASRLPLEALPPLDF